MSAVEALHRPRLTVPLNEHDHVLGPATAPVELVEYGDYECPYCGAAQPAVATVLRARSDDVRFAFRHFPLTQIHVHAGLAAEAAEAAGAQGRFWEMHDMLFANQQRLEPDDLLDYALTVGVDVERFANELESHVHAPRVREHFMSGIRSGVNGTPTFFVNGYRHNGGYSPAELLAAIDEAA
jgi:protein-disulfide isomerase